MMCALRIVEITPLLAESVITQLKENFARPVKPSVPVHYLRLACRSLYLVGSRLFFERGCLSRFASSFAPALPVLVNDRLESLD